MKNYLLLLVCILVSSAAFGQQNPTGRATVIVLADSGVGQMMHLTRFRGPALDYERVDSARVGVDHRARFSVVPDPLKPYQIQSIALSFSNRIYLADGDSLIFSYSESVGDSLLLDRAGANQSFRDSIKPWMYDMKTVMKNMSSMDWRGWQTYLASRKLWFDQKAAWYASKYPEHTGFRNMYENEEIMQYYNSIASYLMANYWDSTGKPVVDDPSRLRVMDSVPWAKASFCQSPELWNTTMFWSNFAWKRWRRAGVDTAGKEYGEEAFLLAHQLPPPARDAAILYILRNCMNRYNPIQGAPLAEDEYEAYKAIASDTAYLGAFHRMSTAFRGQIPGTPAPMFKLPDTANNLRSLSDFRGKIVYLDFWGTWCEPCQKEIPSLLKLEKKFEGDTSVAFVSISIEDKQKAHWKDFIHEKTLNGTQLYAEGRFFSEAAEAYGISAVPTFMIIGRDGKLIDPGAPEPSSGKAEDAIRAALAKAN
jgi:thiol-disulfide isomerase/thioredoxin